MTKFLQRYFLVGLLAVTPLAITVWILWRFYELISNNIGPVVQRIPGLRGNYPEVFLTFVGVVVFVLIITLIGLFARNLIGMAFFRLVERFIEKIPVVKSVFSATKQISQVFLDDRRSAFQRAVLFQYPREGLFSLGFVTRDEPGEELVNVFLPTTPNPTSGFMLMVPRQDLDELPLAVEEAIKLIISGGSIMTAEQAATAGRMAVGLRSRQAQAALPETRQEPGKDEIS